MNNLPAIPSPGAQMSLSDVMAVETNVSQRIFCTENVDELIEMRAKTSALAQYLKSKELHGPMLGAQRRIEARIGQLLGDARAAQFRPGGALPCTVKGLTPTDRQRFRTLARGFGLLADEEWRQPRESLIDLINKKFPVPRVIPEMIIQKDGTIKKPLSKRIEEISALSQQGLRAGQISEKIGISEERVRKIAADAGIVLPDIFIGKGRLDVERILEETISGVSAYVSGLSMLGDLSNQEFKPEQIQDWIGLIGTSVKGLKKLSAALEKLTHDEIGRSVGTDIQAA